MRDRTGVAIVVAALIVGASVVGAGALLHVSIRETAGQLSALRIAVAGVDHASPTAANALAAARPPGPEPGRRHAVETDGSPARGPEDARVAVVEFSDFQCPFCSRVAPTLKQLEKTYGDDIRIVFKHLPLPMHSKAPAAHAAAAAAHRQGKFWEMHDLIFANQQQMGEAKYLEFAEQIGLDVDRFKSDVASAEVEKRIDADVSQAAALGVTGTPGFFINGRFLSGARPLESFAEIIDEELGRS